MRSIEIDTMLTHLLLALRHCDNYKCITSLEYEPEREEVIASYMNSGEEMHLYINVACDSNAAIINDVIGRLDKFFN